MPLRTMWLRGGIEHEKLSLQGFYFNLFDEEREGCVWGDVKEFPFFWFL